MPKILSPSRHRRDEANKSEEDETLTTVDRLVCASGHVVVAGKKNQDRVALGKDQRYYGVFDGHGVTARAADLCATELQEAVAAAGEQLPTDNDDGLPSEAALRAAFHALDERVTAEARKTGVLRMGTCAAGVWLGGFKLDAAGVPSCAVRCGWAGDCEAVLVGSGGGVTRLSSPHRPARADERARIVAADHTPTEAAGALEPSAEQLRLCVSQGKIFRRGSFVARRRLKGGDAVGPECVFAHTGGVSLQISRSIGDPLGPRSVASGRGGRLAPLACAPASPSTARAACAAVIACAWGGRVCRCRPG